MDILTTDASQTSPSLYIYEYQGKEYKTDSLQGLLGSINYEEPDLLIRFIEIHKKAMEVVGSDLDFLFSKLKNGDELLEIINIFPNVLDPASDENVNLKNFIDTVNTMEVDTPSQIMGGGYKRSKSSKRKSSRRKPSRRKTSKRKSSKRKSLKRKSLKRKSSKKKSSRKRR